MRHLRPRPGGAGAAVPGGAAGPAGGAGDPPGELDGHGAVCARDHVPQGEGLCLAVSGSEARAVGRMNAGDAKLGLATHRLLAFAVMGDKLEALGRKCPKCLI